MLAEAEVNYLMRRISKDRVVVLGRSRVTVKKPSQVFQVCVHFDFDAIFCVSRILNQDYQIKMNLNNKYLPILPID